MKINVQKKSQLGSVTLKELLTRQEYLKPTLIMFVLMICRQMTGANYVTFYLNDIFIKADTGFSSELQSTMVSAIAVSRRCHFIFIHIPFNHTVMPFSDRSSGTCPHSCWEVWEEDIVIILGHNMFNLNDFARSLLLFWGEHVFGGWKLLFLRDEFYNVVIWKVSHFIMAEALI